MTVTIIVNHGCEVCGDVHGIHYGISEQWVNCDLVMDKCELFNEEGGPHQITWELSVLVRRSSAIEGERLFFFFEESVVV